MFGRKVVPERGEHHDEHVAPISQGKNAEFIDDVCSVGHGGKQLFKVVLVNTSREE